MKNLVQILIFDDANKIVGIITKEPINYMPGSDEEKRIAVSNYNEAKIVADRCGGKWYAIYHVVETAEFKIGDYLKDQSERVGF